MFFIVFLSNCGVESVYTVRNMKEFIDIVKRNLVRDNGNCVEHEYSVECDKDFGDYVKRTVYNIRRVGKEYGVNIYRVFIKEFIILDGVSIQSNNEVLDFYILVSKNVIDSKKFSRWLYGNNVC